MRCSQPAVRSGVVSASASALLPLLLILLFLVPVYARIGQNVEPTSQLTPPALRNGSFFPQALEPQLDPIDDLHRALEVMQSNYFEVWIGAWPTAIDWTAAVMNTHIASTLATLSKALTVIAAHRSANTVSVRDVENELNRFFGQSVAFYFGEDSFAIRNEAYDDMLWVVLAWLEHIRFMQTHSRLHYHSSDRPFTSWHGSQFKAAFAHRARVFWDLASHGWTTDLCGGGMLWNPALLPYKNAITNQLWISASVGMYLYHPGDNYTSPFVAGNVGVEGLDPVEPHDQVYLEAAIAGYDWLKNIGMTNDLGLYADGFHISGLDHNDTRCDARNEMIYTYNQGVLLSGLRGLWESTGNVSYLTDGHNLVSNVIHATGWSLESGTTSTTLEWAGLGRAGILEEICDSSGDCSQDAQTFKGIYFHHLALFCESLPREPLYPGKTYAAGRDLAILHYKSCQEYAPWVAHNARAAIESRDADGKFGGSWGRFTGNLTVTALPNRAIDYRNNASELLHPPWTSLEIVQPGSAAQSQMQMPLDRAERSHSKVQSSSATDNARAHGDWNDRGRGRTVETQSGGLAVLKALWELLNAA